MNANETLRAQKEFSDGHIIILQGGPKCEQAVSVKYSVSIKWHVFFVLFFRILAVKYFHSAALNILYSVSHLCRYTKSG